jgi:hypothetical protein
MRRIIGSMALGGALLMATVPAVAASGDPTCSELFGGYPHGYHVIADYVTGIGSELLGGPGIDWPPTGLNAAGGAAQPGGPGPGFHFPNDVPPGASFCNPQAKSGDR